MREAGQVPRHNTSIVVGSVSIAVAAVLLWWLFSTMTFVIPAPTDTLGRLTDLIQQGGYWEHIRSTGVAAAAAFLLSVGIGTILGLLLGLTSWVRHIFGPAIVALNGVPKIVLYPVLLLLFGVGGTSKTMMGLLIGVFPVMMNVAGGLQSIPPIYRRLAESLCATRTQTFFHVLLPAIRRPFMTGTRLAVSLSVVGVVLSEIFATEKGLGRLILARYGSGQYAEMLATVILLLVASFLVTFALWRVEKRVR